MATPQAEIFEALSSDSAILEFVDDDTSKITNTFPNINMFGRDMIETNFPRITFVLDDRSHSFHTDNQPVLDELVFAVDIWVPTTQLVKYTLNAIRIEVDRVMLGLGYSKISESELKEVENRISHLTVSYTKEFPTNS